MWGGSLENPALRKVESLCQGWLWNILSPIYKQSGLLQALGYTLPLFPPSSILLNLSSVFQAQRGTFRRVLRHSLLKDPGVRDSSNQDAQPQPPATHRLGYEKLFRKQGLG